jgi:hypothetical protein
MKRSESFRGVLAVLTSVMCCLPVVVYGAEPVPVEGGAIWGRLDPRNYLSSGSGTVVYVRPDTPMGPEICIEINVPAPKRLDYAYDPKTIVIVDAKGKRVEVRPTDSEGNSNIAGWAVSFEAVPAKVSCAGCLPMVLTKITLVAAAVKAAEPLAGNTVPEQPSGPNDSLESYEHASFQVESIDFGKREIELEPLTGYFFYDGNLVLIDAGGKPVDISSVQKGMEVGYTAILRRGDLSDWPHEKKLTKLVLKDFHAPGATASPSPIVSATTGVNKSKTASINATPVGPPQKNGTTNAAIAAKLSESEREKLKRNHYGTFFLDAVPAGYTLQKDDGSKRLYVDGEWAFNVEIREHELGEMTKSPPPGKPFERPSYTTGNFEGYDFFASWENPRVTVALSAGPRYIVEFTFTHSYGEMEDLSRPDVNPVQKINALLAISTPVVDLSRLSADGGWKNASAPTPPPDFLSRLPPNADPSKPTDIDTVMRVLEDQPQKVKDWVKAFYDEMLGRTVNRYYDPGKLALRGAEQHIIDPYVGVDIILRDMDYRGCASYAITERTCYNEVKDSLLFDHVPPNRVEKIAQLAAKIMADDFIARQAKSRERVYSRDQATAVERAREIADKPPGAETGGTPRAKPNETVATKKPTPSHSPLAAHHAEPKIEMEDLGPMPEDRAQIVVSENGLHVAAVVPMENGKIVYYDGKPGPEYDSIGQFGGVPAVVFSKDGTHAAYAARRGESALIWADGKETVLTSRLAGDTLRSHLSVDLASFKFSPGGEHLAYICDAGASQQQMIIDGVQGPVFDHIDPVLFSEQGGHYAYVAHPDQNKSVVVVDGNVGPVFPAVDVDPSHGSSPVLSPDGAHFAYIATRGPGVESWVVIVDGKEGPSYHEITSLQFASNGRLAYLGSKDHGKEVRGDDRYTWAVVVDGKEVGEYRKAEQLQFSPDGNRFACVATTGDGEVVIVDGKPGRVYDSIGAPTFSPDGSRIAYLAFTRAAHGVLVGVLVIDEQESSPKFYKVDKFVFSENGKTAACLAETHEGCIAVVDGQASKPYHECFDIAVSPDGSRYAYAMVGELVVDGRAFKGSFGNLEISFAQKKCLAFSPDSRHLAFAGSIAGGPSGVCVDGTLIPAIKASAKFLFSPDSAHFASLGGSANLPGAVTVDEKTLDLPAVLDRDASLIPKPNAFAFREDGKLKFIGGTKGKIYRVSITPGAAVGSETLTTSAPPISNAPRNVPSQSLRTGGTRSGSSTRSRPLPQPTAQPTPETHAEQRSEGTTATVTSSSAPAPSNTDGSDASGIADKIVQAFSAGDVETLSSLYADTVDYLDSGRISRSAVQDQLQQYFERWPVRQWTITNPVKVESLGASVQRVTFSASYDVSNPQTGRRASGTAKETLMLAADSSGAMKIISQHEQTSKKPSREKSTESNERRDRREKIYRGKPIDGRRPGIPFPQNIPWPPGIPHP